MKSLFHLPQMMHDYCDAKLSDKTIMNEVKTADLVIGDGMYQCSSLIADKFSIPHVTVLQSSLTTATATFPYNFASIPSYIPQFTSRMTDNMNFFQRAENTLRWLVNAIAFPLNFRNVYLTLKKKHNITAEKSLEQTLEKVDLILVQSEAYNYPRPLLPCKKYRIVYN